MSLIYVEDAIVKIEELESYNCSPMYHRGVDECLSVLRKAPKIELVNRDKAIEGEWLQQEDGTHFCINCGKDAMYQRYDDTCFKEILTPSCPYCGALMRIKGLIE